MKHKCTGWAITTTMQRDDGTWYTDTITDINDFTSSIVDEFITEHYKDKEDSNDTKG